MKTKRNSKKALQPIVFLAIGSLIAVNAYALHALLMIAGSWKMSLLPGSVSTRLWHLAIILGINCLTLTYLLLDRFTR